VKNWIQSLSFPGALAVVLGMITWGSGLNAQTAPPPATDQQTQTTPAPATPPTQQTPQPKPSTDTPPAPQAPDQAQAPDSKTSTPTAAVPSASGTQTFMGTVMKSGDKYVLKDDSGKTYDIDHQDDVKKFDGKRVKVQGKLDSTGTKIQVQ
jgi:uncharacterized protein YdeI (BOF family)